MAAPAPRAVGIVTGAASGIGAALVRRLARPGARLLLHTGSNAAGLAAAAAGAAAAGAEVATMTGDLGAAAVPRALVGEAGRRWGRIDYLVANAGYADFRTLEALDRDGLERAFASITAALFELVQAAVPWLAGAGDPRIVAVSSFVAHRFQAGERRFTASAAAKAGLEALAKSMAVQLAERRITVNCVVPGYVRKEVKPGSPPPPNRFDDAIAQIPLRRPGEPDEIAALIGFLLSSQAGYITGQCLAVDGGLTL